MEKYHPYLLHGQILKKKIHIIYKTVYFSGFKKG